MDEAQDQPPSGFTTLEDLPESQPVQQAPGIPPSQQRIPGILTKEPEPPKSWKENKKLAALIGIIGFAVVGYIIYLLFHSIGAI